ncbi:hypothetical protein COO60DRAFT_1694880 [Scenedesmus sp. NREL 46B-D3]|nr:hypothetical protein COO60DRAFT_1694880 [Scenedesmus sp. NREL 46B-D3]
MDDARFQVQAADEALQAGLAEHQGVHHGNNPASLQLTAAHGAAAAGPEVDGQQQQQQQHASAQPVPGMPSLQPADAPLAPSSSGASSSGSDGAAAASSRSLHNSPLSSSGSGGSGSGGSGSGGSGSGRGSSSSSSVVELLASRWFRFSGSGSGRGQQQLHSAQVTISSSTDGGNGNSSSSSPSVEELLNRCWMGDAVMGNAYAGQQSQQLAAALQQQQPSLDVGPSRRGGEETYVMKPSMAQKSGIAAWASAVALLLAVFCSKALLAGPWVFGGYAGACLVGIVVFIRLLRFLASKAGWVAAAVQFLMLSKALLQIFVREIILASLELLQYQKMCKALLQNFIATLHLAECAVRLGSQRLLHWLRECQAEYTKLFNAIQLLVHLVMFVVAQLIIFVHAIYWSAYVIIFAAVQLTLLMNSSDQVINVNGQLINLNNIVATVQHNLHTTALASQQLAQVVDGPQLAMHIANLQALQALQGAPNHEPTTLVTIATITAMQSRAEAAEGRAAAAERLNAALVSQVEALTSGQDQAKQVCAFVWVWVWCAEQALAERDVVAVRELANATAGIPVSTSSSSSSLVPEAEPAAALPGMSSAAAAGLEVGQQQQQHASAQPVPHMPSLQPADAPLAHSSSGASSSGSDSGGSSSSSSVVELLASRQFGFSGSGRGQQQLHTAQLTIGSSTDGGNGNSSSSSSSSSSPGAAAAAAAPYVSDTWTDKELGDDDAGQQSQQLTAALQEQPSLDVGPSRRGDEPSKRQRSMAKRSGTAARASAGAP